MSKVNYKPITEEELDQVSRETAERSRNESRIQQACYVTDTGLISLVMTNQVGLSFTPGALPELENATGEQLAKIAVTRSGNAIHWPDLDIQISSVALVRHLLNLSSIQEAASQGGRARTPAKTAAARQNGKKGGRPSKKATAA